MVPTDKMPGIEINIACIILFIEGTIESNRRVLKILKALKTEKGPEAGIKDTTTIIKSKTFQPSLKNFNLMQESSLEISESVDLNRVLENGGNIKNSIIDYEILTIDTPEDLEISQKLMSLDPIFNLYKK